MRLRNIRRSKNVEDRRGQRRHAGGGGGAGKIGGVGLLIVLAIGYFAGIDVTPLLQQGGAPAQQTSSQPLSPQEAQAGEFAGRVLTTTEAVWDNVFQAQLGRSYSPPNLVLFSQVTQSACGGASGATGPFYCPADKKAYLDTAFFAVLSERMGAKGDFASAYVIAHEVAHHIQNELGILAKTQELRRSLPKVQANDISVRTELQADCFSGVWASQVEDLLEPGDLEEALNAARRIGDDYLQKRAGRTPNPHTYTHGTSAQRARWFANGFQTGDIRACDTFSAEQL